VRKFGTLVLLLALFSFCSCNHHISKRKMSSNSSEEAINAAAVTSAVVAGSSITRNKGTDSGKTVEKAVPSEEKSVKTIEPEESTSPEVFEEPDVSTSAE